MTNSNCSKKNKFSGLLLVATLLMEAFAIVFLKESDSYFSIYFIIGFFGLFSTIRYRNEVNIFGKVWRILLSAFYSVAVTLSNITTKFIRFDSSLFTVSGNIGKYSSFENVANCCVLLLLLAGWFLISLNVLGTLDLIFLPKIDEFIFSDKKSDISHKKIFFISFFVFLSVNIVHFIFFSAPGTINGDNWYQFKQIFGNSYNNHHPFFYTMILRLFITLGINVFGDINFGLALYTIVQIFFVSFCVAWCIRSIHEINGSSKVFVFLMVWYLLPYNIVLASSLTKDVLFSVMMTLVSTELLRIMHGEKNTKLKDYILLFIGAAFIGILRSNGTVIIIFTSIPISIISFRRVRWRRLALTFVMAALLCVILKYPVLRIMNVPQTEFVEGLSIPIQQIARCVADECELTDEEYTFLINAMPIEDIKNSYKNGISDPIKDNVDNEYLSNNRLKCVKTWVSLGIRYPGKYLIAYMDQTKGFWNGGYNYTTVGEYVDDRVKDFGIHKISLLSIKSPSYLITNIFRFIPGLDMMISVGIHIWILLFAFARNVFKGRDKWTFILLPYVLLAISLWMTTPVFSQFRYVYPIIMVIPIILLSLIDSDIDNNGCVSQ